MAWLQDSVKTIASVCALVSLVECAASDEDSADGLRLLCGAAVALSVLSLAAALAGEIF